MLRFSTRVVPILFLWLAILVAGHAQSVKFPRVFAPQGGLVSPYESAARKELCLNGRWRFKATQDLSVPGHAEPGQSWDSVPIKIPSPWNVNAFEMHEGVQGGDFRSFPSYPEPWNTAKAAWMERTFTVPKSWTGLEVSLHFGAVAGKLIVFVNGQRVGEGFDIFFAQDFDITDKLRFGAENKVLVKVVAPSVFDKPGPYGHRDYVAGSFWGSSVAGIWQDVFLEGTPKVAINDVFVQPIVDRDQLIVQATVSNHTLQETHVAIGGTVRKWIDQAPSTGPEVKWKLAYHKSLNLPSQNVTLEPGETRQVTMSAKVVNRLDLWSPSSPNLYGLVLSASPGSGDVDLKYQRFGWRQFAIRGKDLTLNGRPIKLNGDSWHFLGIPQMTRRYAWAWFKLLHDAGANSVRLHATVYPSFYHDMADEMGVMVLDESAIWLSDGGSKVDSETYWQNCKDHISKLVMRDRNHPSVFGWSIENEMLPVLRGVWNAPQSMIDRSLREVDNWAEICRDEDPTRDWISGDGEWDEEGRLPVISIHYGDENSFKNAEKSGKPWGVGEASMAYYGTPNQAAQFKPRAYESDEARMQALGKESFQLLKQQQQHDAAYRSVFNIVWYGVQPLPLGKSNLSKPISLSEGITFPEYREGVPGVQPERIGSYCTTLNPGYDPRLPLYKPWPMFDAIKAANQGKLQTWPVPTGTPLAVGLPGSEPLDLSYVSSNAEHASKELARIGVSVHACGQNETRLFIDASKAGSIAACHEPVRRVLDAGGDIWVWGTTPESATEVGNLFGVQIQAEKRDASSFVPGQPDPLLTVKDEAALYFSESEDWKQMSYGLSGGFLKGAKVLLEACPADWRKWNYQAEPVKTAALFRSEHEQTGSRVVLAIKQVGKGRAIFCNLSPQVKSTRKYDLVTGLLRNDGIHINPLTQGEGMLDFDGRLTKALVCGSIAGAEYGDHLDVEPGTTFGGKKWQVRAAVSDAVFDLRRLFPQGPLDNSSAYLAWWIKSPKPLNDLLSEPNLPKLTFTFGSDDGNQVWLNGQRLANNERVGPVDPNQFKIEALPLRLGWNLLVVKVVQIGGEWKFTGKFGSTDWDFIQKLEFKTTAPDKP